MPLNTFGFICLTLYFYSHIPLVNLQNPMALFTNTVVSAKDPAVWCKFQPNGFDCKDTGRITQDYFYDTKLEDCKLFDYGTCDDEPNRFKSLTDCREACQEAGINEVIGNVSAEIYCRFQPDFGLCNDYYPMFYFDISTRTCLGFSFSGCGGNPNRFHSPHDCSSTCSQFTEEEAVKERSKQ